VAEFLTTYGISANIEQIISDAESRIFILSPFLKLPPILFDRLKDADRKGIKTAFIYGKEELKSEQKDLLSQLANLEVRFFRNMHAKCYFNENRMVIASMNLHHYSESNNREMGVLILRNEDPSLFKEALNEATSIWDNASGEASGRSTNVRESPNHEYIVQNQRGYCIRCGKRVDLNPEAPYCRDCYHIWAEFSNPSYEEKNCHVCGKPYATSMGKPMCRACYKFATRG